MKITKISVIKLDYNRFEADFSFNKKIIDICKTIPGRKFNLDDKKWSFPMNKYAEFVEKCESTQLVQFKKKLSKKELNDFQVLIHTDEPGFSVSFPKNDELKKFVKELKAEWDENKFCWLIKEEKKEAFLNKLKMMKIKTINYSEPPLSKFITF